MYVTRHRLSFSFSFFFSLSLFFSLISCWRRCIRPDPVQLLCVGAGVGEGMEAEPKRNKTERFFGTRTQKNPSPGRTELIRTMGLFRRYHLSTLINYKSNLSMCGIFLKGLLPPPDIRELLSTQKGAYDLNLSTVSGEFGHFDPQHRFLVPKNCTIMVCFHLLVWAWVWGEGKGRGGGRW